MPARSGRTSRAGLRSGRGLNENLAREILELHTLSPAAGYTQRDVTSLACLLTGWSFQLQGEPAGFVFRRGAHEPGAKTLMGKRFEEGEQGTVEALRWLAAHPATQWHLATKLLRHFVADEPPPTAVAGIAGVLRDTAGDLGAAARALLRLPEAWEPPLSKLRAPQDYAVAVLRAVAAPEDLSARLPNIFARLGQPLWAAPQPDGWADAAAEWAVPEAMLRRIEWAHEIAGRFARRDAAELVRATLGPLARPETMLAAARAGSARDALTLVLTSPEFQRR